MRSKIENPKVFISYAWGSNEYQDRVISFATDLMSNGVDVVLDKWDLSEGNDTYAFMEKCATDKSITNVLMLLDPIYAEKADGRFGGVGTETQIISSEVYGKVEQDKFIPIVFARNEDGNICKPTYLKALLHFDLSKDESFDIEYQRLVKRLYGVEIYAKPQLGNKPEWVDSSKIPAVKSLTKYDGLKQNVVPAVKKDIFSKSMDEIKALFVHYGEENLMSSYDCDEYLKLYDGMQEIRNNYLALLPYYVQVIDSVATVGDFLESLQNIAKCHDDSLSEVKRIFVHEIFIYTIAYLLKRKDYQSAGYLLGRTYFDDSTNQVENFSFFYSASYHTNLDKCICKRDSKNYYSGTATHWIETLSETTCSRSDLVLADILCYNYSLLGINCKYYCEWFPILYPYGGGFEFTGVIKPIATRLQSKEFLEKFLVFFGHKNKEQFIEKFEEVKNSNELNKHRFQSAFEPAPSLVHLISSDKIGVLP